uniref:NADH-ubiquinone oxidoreductase chain 4 n=1 Tax=Eupelmus anpingensis TaxID=2989843 RepID=A0A9E7V2X1_9HYME|nr:NADH dehydrogenase subunit 4 [Eupelmus anpingensis]UYR45769.1 NADH dehydrogenase subunit 4 [Eupelmus anpingensis]
MMLMIMLIFYFLLLIFLKNMKNMKFIILMMLIFFLLIKFNYYLSWQMIYGIMGIDIVSFLMILLTLWIFSMMEMVIYLFKNKLMNLILTILLISLILCFSSMNFLIYYLFFEISLVPTFYLILGFGYQPERLNSGMYMLMYTLFASLPLFILIFLIFDEFNSLNYLILLNNMMKINMMNELLYILMTLAFMVKLPLFLFHFWLPKAHVEAPVIGSMILAGVMLKLGGYGLIRSLTMMMNLSMKFNYLYYSMSLVCLINLSILCLRQTDLKLLVAYSSVVHMGVMLLGLLSMENFGFIGGTLMMIGHGLCSSALFFSVNLMYERIKSRNMYLSKGMMVLFPSFSMFWFMLCVCNMSSPPSINLLSELMLIYISLNWSFNIIILLILGIYLSACYSLYLYSYTHHGKLNSLYLMSNSIKMNDYMNLLNHWIPLNLMILLMKNFY